MLGRAPNGLGVSGESNIIGVNGMAEGAGVCGTSSNGHGVLRKCRRGVIYSIKCFILIKSQFKDIDVTLDSHKIIYDVVTVLFKRNLFGMFAFLRCVLCLFQYLDESFSVC